MCVGAKHKVKGITYLVRLYVGNSPVELCICVWWKGE